MITKDQVESWILDYSCKHKLNQIVIALSQRCNGQLTLFDVPQIRLVICAFHRIVSTGDIDHFEDVIDQLEIIYKCCHDIIPFKLYSKLCSGLKMKVLLNKLQKSDRNVLIYLNHYFPRLGRDYIGVKKKEIARLHSVEMNFRKFFLPLIAHENQRKAYFKDEYQDEYGEVFLGALRTLTSMFIDRVEAELPQTVIEKILVDGIHIYTSLQDNTPDIALEMLLDTLQGKKNLTEKDLLDLLTMLSPVCTQDRIDTDHQVSPPSEENRSVGRTNSDSLFSSESSDPKNNQEFNQNLENCVQNTSDLVTNFFIQAEFDRNKQNIDQESELEKSTNSSGIRKGGQTKGSHDREMKTHGQELLKSGIDRLKDRKNVEDKEQKIESSGESVFSSDKSVSLLDRNNLRRDKTIDNVKPSKQFIEDSPDQVYTITSSSDSNPCQQNEDMEVDIRLDASNSPERLKEDSDIEVCVCESTDENLDKSVLNIDDHDEVIPPSRTEDLEFWDVFSDDPLQESQVTQLYQLPSIRILHPDIKLCVVKLYRRQDLDIFDKDLGGNFQMYV